MINRDISSKIFELAKLYPVITLTGPRQSGKTTLVKKLFPTLSYVNLENPDTRLLAESDPRKFLAEYQNGVILDEVQRLPDLFSYIQTIVDETNRPGSFILTGSQNFLLLEKVTQSLAGRTAVLRLLPFSLDELSLAGKAETAYECQIYKGFYPRLYDVNIPPSDFYPYYLETYVERDVRQIKNISNLQVFIKFLKMCAARIGQLLNLSSLASDCGIAVSTAQQWLDVLETSYVVYLLKPHYANFNKRLIKMPKLYFFDTGLACSLLNIGESNQLQVHYLKGSLFENMVIVEFIKRRFNQGLSDNCFFWRDKTGNEIDLLIETSTGLIAIEIKAGETFVPDYFKGLKYWHKLSGNAPDHSFVIYGGDIQQQVNEENLLSWRMINQIKT